MTVIPTVTPETVVLQSKHNKMLADSQQTQESRTLRDARALLCTKASAIG